MPVPQILSENKVILLAKGVLNKGFIRAEEAVEVYSSQEAARSALQSLRAWGYIRLTEYIGVFRVIKVPPESEIMAENLRKEQEALKK